MYARNGLLEGLYGLRRRTQGVFVGGQLDNILQTILFLNLGDGLARYIRADAFNCWAMRWHTHYSNRLLSSSGDLPIVPCAMSSRAEDCGPRADIHVVVRAEAAQYEYA